MHTTNRVEAAFTATLSAALLALGVTAFATIDRPAAEPALQATLPAVTIVGDRAAIQAELCAPAATTTAAAQNDGSVARKAS